MFFREVLNEDLGCASYVIADGGEAVVVDPKWEVEDYIEIAEDNGFRISHIVETHNHADHVSGRGRLVEASGAKIHISENAGVDYDHEPLSDGDVVEVGKKSSERTLCPPIYCLTRKIVSHLNYI